MSASDYGSCYWCVKTPHSDDGEVYLHADKATVDASGALVFTHEGALTHEDTPMVVFAAGEWKVFFAAAVMDGHAVAAEYWAGEVRR